MTKKLKKAICLVGMMGAGKTAIGKALAQHLDVAFMDSDAEIEKAANMSIAEIFERDGEAFFRQKETQVISRLLDQEGVILSTGGGAFMSGTNRELMSQKGVSVWLDADLDVLWKRVQHKDTRPLLRTPNPFETLKSIYEARTGIYALADVVIKARAEYSIEQTMNAVLDGLAARPDVLEMKNA